MSEDAGFTLFAVFVVLVFFAWQCSEERACEKKDGVYLWRVYTCVKKDSVIKD